MIEGGIGGTGNSRGNREAREAGRVFVTAKRFSLGRRDESMTDAWTKVRWGGKPGHGGWGQKQSGGCGLRVWALFGSNIL